MWRPRYKDLDTGQATPRPAIASGPPPRVPNRATNLVESEWPAVKGPRCRRASAGVASASGQACGAGVAMVGMRPPSLTKPHWH